MVNWIDDPPQTLYLLVSVLMMIYVSEGCVRKTSNKDSAVIPVIITISFLSFFIFVRGLQIDDTPMVTLALVYPTVGFALTIGYISGSLKMSVATFEFLSILQIPMILISFIFEIPMLSFSTQLGLIYGFIGYAICVHYGKEGPLYTFASSITPFLLVVWLCVTHEIQAFSWLHVPIHLTLMIAYRHSFTKDTKDPLSYVPNDCTPQRSDTPLCRL